MSSVTFSMRLDPATKQALEDTAKALDRTPSYLANKAIEVYLEARTEKRQAILEAIAEADKGYFISSGSMHRWMDSWDTDNELPRPDVDIFPETQ